MDNPTVVKGAIELISDPSHWTQNTMARNARGDTAAYHDPDARQWCAYGALLKSAFVGSVLETDDAVDPLMDELNNLSVELYEDGKLGAHEPDEEGDIDGIVSVNDFLGRDAVLKVFNAYLEQEPSDAS